MCFAQGHKTVPLVGIEPRTVWTLDSESDALPLHHCVVPSIKLRGFPVFIVMFILKTRGGVTDGQLTISVHKSVHLGR